MSETPLTRTATLPASETIKVLVRIRPMTTEEASEGSVVTVQDSTSLTLGTAEGRKNFRCSFDSIIGPDSTQAEVYDTVKVCTNSVIDGFNSTIFAYGQTGSGKTHTMFGPPNMEEHTRLDPTASTIGLIPRAVADIFSLSNHAEVMQYSVLCSFVQLYNENCYDMLRDPNMAFPLSIREDRGEIYVQGLSEYIVKSVHETLQLLRVAEEHRVIRETHMNLFSSRSHSIFQIFVEQRRVASDGGEIHLRSKFNLVDLAGSEKWNTKMMMKDDHISELTNINLSLHTLGKCISSLAKAAQGKEAHVPYRESKLTRLLQDSLGGNSRTYLIATINPATSNFEESVSTLKFADRAKQVMVMVTVNETRPVDYETVKRLQREVESLKAQLRKYTSMNHCNTSTEQDGDTFSLTKMDSTMDEQKSQLLLLQNENSTLKQEVDLLREKNSSLESQKPPQGPDSALLEQNQRMWCQIDLLQDTFTKFFKFDIEEDVMRRLVEQTFVTLYDLRKRQPKNFVPTGAASKPANDIWVESPRSQQMVSPRTQLTKLKRQSNKDESDTAANATTSNTRRPKIKMPRIPGATPNPNSTTETATKPHPRSILPGLSNIIKSGDASGISSNVAYRVRGSSVASDDSDWVEPLSAEDEEKELRKHLAAAKKKMARNEKLQMWMKEKELKAQEQLQRENEEKLKAAEAERLRELKRRERAEKQKRKLHSYYEKVKSDVEMLKEIKEMGFDPEDLV